VDFTPKLIELLDAELERDGAEVVLVHNHRYVSPCPVLT
jgi:hypothetical protein